MEIEEKFPSQKAVMSLDYDIIRIALTESCLIGSFDKQQLLATVGSLSMRVMTSEPSSMMEKVCIKVKLRKRSEIQYPTGEDHYVPKPSVWVTWSGGVCVWGDDSQLRCLSASRRPGTFTPSTRECDVGTEVT
ncbi:hypothetical protein J6590_016714 [Homalodisca vitripennis]|nr:hypothetical protein J6590_016714 [Homalodisca vitripennis]